MTDAEEPNAGELILHRTSEGTVRIEVLYESDFLGLNQKKIAELFGAKLPTISYHLEEIYSSGTVSRNATLKTTPRVHTRRATAKFADKSSSTTSTPPFRWVAG